MHRGRRGNNDVHFRAHQLSSHDRVALDVAVRVARLDGEVLPLGVARLAHALHECGVAAGLDRGLPRAEIEESNAPELALLLRERAAGCPAKREDRKNGGAPIHWITSSARTSTDCGILMPSAFAVFRFTTSSNLLGSSIGRSP